MRLRLEQFSELLRVKLRRKGQFLDHLDEVEGSTHLWIDCRWIVVPVPPKVIIGVARLEI